MDADEIIARYTPTPHPEGGHYREIFRTQAEDGGRGAVTSIYYLLRAGEISAWQRADAVEIWHYHIGDALRPSFRSMASRPRATGSAWARAPGKALVRKAPRPNCNSLISK